MIIKGHLGKPPEKQISGAGKPYYTMRVAENYGRDENRKTVWFDIVAAIPPLEADMLAAGQAVAVDGRLEPTAYVKKRQLVGVPVPTTWEQVIKCLQAHGALGVGLKVLTQDVRPHRFERRQATEDTHTSAGPAPGPTTENMGDGVKSVADAPAAPEATASPAGEAAPAALAATAASELSKSAPF